VGQVDKERSRQHLAIDILASAKQQNLGTTKHREVLRYRAQRIQKCDLVELTLKTSKLRNNWRSCDRGGIIHRLEMMTNLVIETLKRLQETKAKVCLARHGGSTSNVLGIMKRLAKIKTRGLATKKLFSQSCTVRQLKREKDRVKKTRRTKNKLIKELRQKIVGDDLALWS